MCLFLYNMNVVFYTLLRYFLESSHIVQFFFVLINFASLRLCVMNALIDGSLIESEELCLTFTIFAVKYR